jgi:serine/threonine protein kinase
VLPASPVTCLGDDTIAAYVDGALDVAGIAAVDAHIDGCVPCRAQLSAVVVPRSFVEPMRTLPVSRARAPEPGDTLGRYVVEHVIGRGGMGVVVRAHDPELDRAVAIKLVDPAAGGGSWRARLRAEARAMARLRHRNVVTVHDVGTVGDQVFVAMELIDGTSLSAWLAGGRRPRDVLAHCIAAGRGLAAAHAAGLVHGDVKPDNVLIDRDGRALIGDFGLARDDGTAVRGLAGTPAYFAPELFRRAPPDHRSDQYALAVTVYEAIAGARPAQPPSRPAGLPRWAWRVVARGLAVEPAARFPSVTAFVDALERGLRRRRRIALALAAASGIAITGVVAFAVARR